MIVDENANLQSSQENTVSTESSEVVQNESTPESQPTKKSESELNFERLRAENKRLQQERDEILKHIKQQQEAQKQKVVDDTKDFNVAPDDIVEGRHLSKYDKEIKLLKEQLNKYQQQNSQSSAEIKLKSKYPDFDKVVTSETIKGLRDKFPEIASTINSTSDLYTKGTSAYTLIKQLGIYKEDQFVKEKEAALNNISKPRPVSSIAPQEGSSPLSRANAFANGLTDELKEQLRKEMSSSRKNY